MEELYSSIGVKDRTIRAAYIQFNIDLVFLKSMVLWRVSRSIWMRPALGIGEGLVFSKGRYSTFICFDNVILTLSLKMLDSMKALFELLLTDPALLTGRPMSMEPVLDVVIVSPPKLSGFPSISALPMFRPPSVWYSQS